MWYSGGSTTKKVGGLGRPKMIFPFSEEKVKPPKVKNIFSAEK